MSGLILWVAIVAAALFAVDRVALWAARRGWRYWRKTNKRLGGIGDAFLDVTADMSPGAQHMVEAKRTKKREDRGASDPPSQER